MTHEYLHISTDKGKTWRDMLDTQRTADYISKLSHAATVLVRYDDGDSCTVECGKTLRQADPTNIIW